MSCPSRRLRLSFPASTDAFLQALPGIAAFEDECDFSGRERYAVDLALEELITNTINHGGQEEQEVTIELALTVDPQAICLKLRDNGAPFDPTAHATPDHIDSILEDRPIGGLGIHLTQQQFDELHYDYADNQNCLTATLHRS